MNLLDLLLASVIAYCLIRGVFRGLIKELSSIVGVLGGFYAAYSYYSLLARHIIRWVGNSGYANIISCLIIFLGVYLAISLMGTLMKYLLDIVFLGWVDRFCGLFFGTLKGMLIVAAIVVPLTTFLPRNTTMLKDSIIVRYTAQISAVLVHVGSTDMQHLFTQRLKELQISWRQKIK